MSNKTKKIILYLFGIVAGAGLCFYFVWATIFYAWMNANGSWSAEKAAPWAYGSLALAVVFFVLAIYIIVKLIKYINSLPKFDVDE